MVKRSPHLEDEFHFPDTKSVAAIIRKWQAEDLCSQAGLSYFNEGKFPEDEQMYKWIRSVGDQLQLDENGLLMRHFSNIRHGETIYGPRLIYVPENERTILLKEAHTIPGGVHPDTEKTLQTLRTKFFWPQMSRDVHKFCKLCEICIKWKGQNRPIHPPLKPILPPKEPLEQVTLDVLKLPLTSSGNTRALVGVDYLTKLMWFELMQREDSVMLSKTFAKMFKNTGFPRIVVTDQGTNIVLFDVQVV